ncbi:ABC transporter ATP-binding protein, partial [Pasteurella multocida]|uniref:ABC transporter ATP-binding protein n=1 Tax=Pasteurella multocida TaxID=747 RepID=UPI00227D3E65
MSELSLSYHPSSKTVLDQISFELPQGQIACLVGQSGCGKTSLLRCIAGFETPTAGSIQFGKRTLFDSRTHINIPAYQRQIGIVFQDYALFPHLTVADNIGFGLQHLSKNDRQSSIDALLTLIRLEQLACRYPHELSGGQQQRVALARAIAPNPQLILFDEPFS